MATPKEGFQVNLTPGINQPNPIQMMNKRTPSGFDPNTAQATETEQSSPKNSSHLLQKTMEGNLN